MTPRIAAPRSHPPAASRRAAALRNALLFAPAVVLGCARAAAPTPAPVPAQTAPAEPASAAALVRAMHDRYAGRWFRTFTFLQNNTLYRAGGGEDRSQWMEYMAVPGRLRIEYLPATSKSGVLFENGRVHAFDAGKRVQTQSRIHPLLLMAADVYAIEPAVTLRRLDSLGVDTSRFRVDTLGGTRAYVVGGAPGDSTAPQVWVEADRLVALRVIERETRGTRSVVTDSRFSRYVEMEGLPIAVEMLFLRDGRPIFKEEYADVKLNVPLSDALFDPEKWGEAKP
jgi:hypothetical protein